MRLNAFFFSRINYTSYSRNLNTVKIYGGYYYDNSWIKDPGACDLDRYYDLDHWTFLETYSEGIWR